MCVITAIFKLEDPSEQWRDKALKMSKKIRHRGPDWSGVYQGKSAILCHERLSIVDPRSGCQPLFSPDGSRVLAVNGEIYNHREIRKWYEGRYDFQTGSDCEVILALYRDWKAMGADDPKWIFERLNGIFAFCLYDEETDEYIIGRDPIGVIPLYIGRDADGKCYVGSELKALEGFCDEYEPFIPGHYYFSRHARMERWYTREWMEKMPQDCGGETGETARLSYKESVQAVHDSLEAAVKRQLMCDVPYGVLLSGGLDSSVTSAIAKKFSAHRIEAEGDEKAWWPRLHSFAVGLKGAPDLAKAKVVADYIGTVHHEINYTIQEGLDAIRDVIYFIEKYDVTKVKESTKMYNTNKEKNKKSIKKIIQKKNKDKENNTQKY